MKLEVRTVYHYTSLETLFKILDGVKDGYMTFYATRISELNDTSELIYGFKKFWDYLPDIERELHINRDEFRLSRITDSKGLVNNEGLPFVITKELKENRQFPFVISFSNAKDSLPMWNTYASNGQGVALGLKLQVDIKETQIANGTVIDFTAYDPKMVHSISVYYGDISKKSLAYKYVKMLYFRYYKEVLNVTEKGHIRNMQLNLIKEIATSSSVLLKHPSYSYEKESRYFGIVQDYNSIQFRTNAKGNVIPYVEIKIPTSKFVRIIIAPCRDMNTIEDIIQLRLKQKEINKIKIEKSKIPYREI